MLNETTPTEHENNLLSCHSRILLPARCSVPCRRLGFETKQIRKSKHHSSGRSPNAHTETERNIYNTLRCRCVHIFSLCLLAAGMRKGEESYLSALAALESSVKNLAVGVYAYAFSWLGRWWCSQRRRRAAVMLGRPPADCGPCCWPDPPRDDGGQGALCQDEERQTAEDHGPWPGWRRQIR